MLFESFQHEEKLRKRKEELQIMEGEALVQQAQLSKEMEDQKVLERRRMVKKSNHTEKALQLHATSPDTTSIDKLPCWEYSN